MFTIIKKLFNNLSKKELLILFLSAFFAITIFSKSSFLYPLNDWGDANCYFTVGKSLLAGKVLYKDIYEQKGPFLYFLHSLCSLISRTSFFGVYLLEIFCAFFFLLFSYKSIKLFITKNNNKFLNAIYYIPFIAVFIYSLESFCHGDSVEEISLPLLAFTIYIGLKHLHRNTLPNFKEGLLIGIASSLIFWMKYTLVRNFCSLVFIHGIYNCCKKRI